MWKDNEPPVVRKAVNVLINRAAKLAERYLQTLHNDLCFNIDFKKKLHE